MSVRLALDDIQAMVFRDRPMPCFGAYLLFRVDDGAVARRALADLLAQVTSARRWNAPESPEFLNVFFSAEGLRRMGVDPRVLAAFPAPFALGMAARRQYLGDVGDSDPGNWDWPHGGNGFHLGAFIMAESEAGFHRQLETAHGALLGKPELRLLSRLDFGVPVDGRDHFGYVHSRCRPFIEGEGGRPQPGQRRVSAGEFVLGYENELGRIASLPGPEVLWRNGTFVSIRKIRQHVGGLRRYLEARLPAPAGGEIVTARMMERWLSGCPLSPLPARSGKDAIEEWHLGRIPARRPNARLHAMVTRDTLYGPGLSETAAADDGEDRGVILTAINADPLRQFEFVQGQWVDHGSRAGHEPAFDGPRPPRIGANDDEGQWPSPPNRVNDFSVVRGGEHVFLPSLTALRWIAGLPGGIASGRSRGAAA